jgi:G3E family GTPase
VTGFLGAGKTTFLARALSPRGAREEDAPLRIGLIINEVGIAGTDGVAAESADFLELTEGCVCCTRNPDLIAALGEYAARGDLDRVIIETTGVADPLAITFLLERPDVTPLARLDAVVTVVDAENWRRVADQPEWRAQLGAADLVVLAKTDLAPDIAALQALVAELNPAARVLGNEVPLSVLLDAEPVARRTGTPSATHSGFRAVSIADRAAYDLDALEDLLETLPPEVYRGKGVVRVGGGRWISFHVVAGRLALTMDVAAPAHGENRMVFIGQGLEREGIAAALAECLG